MPAEIPALSLAELQQSFMAYLSGDSKTIKTVVKGTPKVSIDTRLGIYAHAYESRLLETLQENFQAVHTLLGDDAFHELAQHYIRQYPSTHFSLRYFGDRLVDVLETLPPYAEQPVLAEMARFEWAIWAAFDARDEPTASISDLQAVPAEYWGALTFTLHASVQWVSLQSNVPTLWQAISDDAEPIATEMAEYPVTWLIWRQDLGTYFRALAVDEAWALLQLRQGGDFGMLCEGICEWVDADNAPVRVVGFLQNWLADGVIHRLQAF